MGVLLCMHMFYDMQAMDWLSELCIAVTKDFMLPHNQEEVEQLMSELKRLKATAQVKPHLN